MVFIIMTICFHSKDFLPRSPRYSRQPCDVDPLILRDSGINLIHLKGKEITVSCQRSQLGACWNLGRQSVDLLHSPFSVRSRQRHTVPMEWSLLRHQSCPWGPPLPFHGTLLCLSTSSLARPEARSELRNSQPSNRRTALSCFLHLQRLLPRES